MRRAHHLVLIVTLCLGTLAHADAPMASRLQLDVEQSRQLADIEAQYRRDFAALRQEHNRESRALRRARLANDSGEITRLEAVVESHRTRLQQMRQAQDARIVALLQEEQLPLFEAYVAERRQMHGSSRDEQLFD